MNKFGHKILISTLFFFSLGSMEQDFSDNSIKTYSINNFLEKCSEQELNCINSVARSRLMFYATEKNKLGLLQQLLSTTIKYVSPQESEEVAYIEKYCDEYLSFAQYTFDKSKYFRIDGSDTTYFLHNKDVNIKNKKGESLLSLACLTGNLDLVNFLIDKGADLSFNSSLFHSACATNNREVCLLLLQQPALKLTRLDIETVNKKFANDQEVIDLVKKKLDEQTKN